MTPPPSLYKILVELVIRLPFNIHPLPHIYNVHGLTHPPTPIHWHAHTYGMRTENTSKSDKNLTSDKVQWWVHRIRVFSKLIPGCRKSLLLGSWDFGLGLRNAIFLVTLRWPVWEINPMPEDNRGKICTPSMSHIWLDFPVMLVYWVS